MKAPKPRKVRYGGGARKRKEGETDAAFEKRLTRLETERVRKRRVRERKRIADAKAEAIKARQEHQAKNRARVEALQDKASGGRSSADTPAPRGHEEGEERRRTMEEHRKWRETQIQLLINTAADNEEKQKLSDIFRAVTQQTSGVPFNVESRNGHFCRQPPKTSTMPENSTFSPDSGTGSSDCNMNTFNRGKGLKSLPDPPLFDQPWHGGGHGGYTVGIPPQQETPLLMPGNPGSSLEALSSGYLKQKRSNETPPLEKTSTKSPGLPIEEQQNVSLTGVPTTRGAAAGPRLAAAPQDDLLPSPPQIATSSGPTPEPPVEPRSGIPFTKLHAAEMVVLTVWVRAGQLTAKSGAPLHVDYGLLVVNAIWHTYCRCCDILGLPIPARTDGAPESCAGLALLAHVAEDPDAANRLAVNVEPGSSATDAALASPRTLALIKSSFKSTVEASLDAGSLVLRTTTHDHDHDPRNDDR